MELLNQLGINTTLFLAQLVNFVIVLFVLYIFVYKPVLEILDKRKDTIEKSLNDAKLVEKNLKQANEKAQDILNDARKEADAIMLKTKQLANDERQEMLNQTKQEIEELTKKQKLHLEAQKEEMLSELRFELVDMTVFTLAHIADKSLSKEVDKKHIEQIIKQL